MGVGPIQPHLVMQCPMSENLAFGLVSVSACVGVASSLVLLVVSLTGGQRRAVLSRLVTGLAVADLLTNLWVFVPSWLEQRHFFVFPAVRWCGGWSYVSFVLIMWSDLIAASIALSVLLALMAWAESVERMRWAPLAALPLALLINCGQLLSPAHAQDDSRHMPNGLRLDCKPSPGSYSIFLTALMGSLFLVMTGAAVGFLKLRRSAPESAAKRAFSCARRYLLAFAMTWLGKACSLPTLTQQDTSARMTCDQWALTFVADAFIFLGGFWNLLAYHGLNFKMSSHKVVTFRSSASLATGSGTPLRVMLPREPALDPWLLLWGAEPGNEDPDAGLALPTSHAGAAETVAPCQTPARP